MKVSVVLPLLEKAMNTYLQLGEVTPASFAKLKSKVVAITLEGVGLSFYLSFTDKQVFVYSQLTEEASLSVSAPPFTLLQLFAEGERSELLFSDKVTIKGDVAVAQALQDFFKAVDIDWVYYLSLLTGDVIADQGSKAFASGFAQLKQLSKNFRANVMEYLQEEADLVPPKLLADEFFDEVDKLRNDVARLELRVQRLVMKANQS